MDPFTCTDIYETKGIEYLVVIAFLLLIIPVWIVLNRPLNIRSRVRETAGALTYSMLRIPPGLFFSKNHTWSHHDWSGLARIGLDDLLLHLTGGVEVGFLREKGSKVEKGEVMARIMQNGKSLEITSPVTGAIELVNRTLEKNPGALLEDPYDSWLYQDRPEKWQEEIRGEKMAGEASSWMIHELDRFKDFLAGATATAEHPGAGIVLQEGGELIDFPLSRTEQQVWSDFQLNFLERLAAVPNIFSTLKHPGFDQ